MAATKRDRMGVRTGILCPKRSLWFSNRESSRISPISLHHSLNLWVIRWMRRVVRSWVVASPRTRYRTYATSSTFLTKKRPAALIWETLKRSWRACKEIRPRLDYCSMLTKRPLAPSMRSRACLSKNSSTWCSRSRIKSYLKTTPLSTMIHLLSRKMGP